MFLWCCCEEREETDQSWQTALAGPEAAHAATWIFIRFISTFFLLSLVLYSSCIFIALIPFKHFRRAVMGGFREVQAHTYREGRVCIYTHQHIWINDTMPRSQGAKVAVNFFASEGQLRFACHTLKLILPATWPQPSSLHASMCVCACVCISHRHFCHHHFYNIS